MTYSFLNRVSLDRLESVASIYAPGIAAEALCAVSESRITEEQYRAVLVEATWQNLPDFVKIKG